jgi:hypothetical protein
VSPSNGGTVERTTKQLNADAPCSYPSTVNVDLGDDIIIEAVPSSGYHFIGWSGEEDTLDMDDNPLEITFKNSISLTANFAPKVIEFTSQDGLLNLLIPDGTTALDEENEPISSVEFTVEESPPSPHEASIVGQAYTLEPYGATFEPPVTLTWRYAAVDIPEEATEEELVIAYYDEDASEWVALDSDVDPTEDMISAPVEHLTTFAVLAPLASTPSGEPTFTTDIFSISPDEVSPGSTVTISALVTNESQVELTQSVTLTINGATEETVNDITLSPGAFTVVTFEVVRNETGSYLVDVNGDTAEFTVTGASATPSPPTIAPPSTETTPPQTSSSGVNWSVVAPILSAVFLAIFIPIRLKRRRESLDW